MGILDSVLGSVLGGSANSPMGTILGQILGGGGQSNQGGGLGGLLGGLTGGSSGGMAGGGGMGGALGGLLGQLRQSGLGSQVDSWVGTGHNNPVAPSELQNAFGQDQVDSWAAQAGMPTHDFLSQLSQHLPNAINQMTPDGRLPDEGTVSV